MNGAAEFIQYRMNVRNGSFYCGDSEEKGKTIVIQNAAQKDKIKRYTDKYLTSRRIGNTVNDYPYFTDLLGTQILTFIGAKKPESGKRLKSSKGKNGVANIESVLAEDEEDAEIERDEEEVEPVEDEFEEYDDGDYNAERYFDDGDGDGDIDDGGEPDYS